MARDYQVDECADASAKLQSHRESDENYHGVLYRAGRWRVAICRDRIQYLLQRQRPGKAGVGAAWDSRRYCVTSGALIRDWHALTGDPGTPLRYLLPERARMLRG